jgi:hypothetical protein
MMVRWLRTETAFWRSWETKSIFLEDQTMKTKRYVYEYANDEIRHFTALAKKFPESEEHFFRKIDDIKRAVWCVERSYITIPEAMRIISEPLSE